MLHLVTIATGHLQSYLLLSFLFHYLGRRQGGIDKSYLLVDHFSFEVLNHVGIWKQKHGVPCVVIYPKKCDSGCHNCVKHAQNIMNIGIWDSPGVKSHYFEFSVNILF